MRTNCTLYANGTLLLPRKFAATYLPGDRVELLNCTIGANEGVYSVRHSSPTLVIIQTVEGQAIECAGTHDTCTAARPQLQPSMARHGLPHLQVNRLLKNGTVVLSTNASGGALVVPGNKIYIGNCRDRRNDGGGYP